MRVDIAGCECVPLPLGASRPIGPGTGDSIRASVPSSISTVPSGVPIVPLLNSFSAGSGARERTRYDESVARADEKPDAPSPAVVAVFVAQRQRAERAGLS